MPSPKQSLAFSSSFGPLFDQARYGPTLNTINQAIHHGVLFVGAIVVLQLLWDIGRISLDAYRSRVAS
jgi:hypothetical protein